MATSQFKLRGLKKTDGKSFHTNDVIHKSIRLCPLTVEILDTPEMQRLRRLKQLGASEYTYVNANHTRFEHSLGVAHLAEEILTRIRSKQPQLNITDKDVVCVKIAGMLHDCGHGPFSHIYDGMFRDQLAIATNTRKWLGDHFDVGVYTDLPDEIEGWAHEDGSLMMIDSLLNRLGLEIDDEHLDQPLKQIGDGIDANNFGITDAHDSKKKPLSADKVLTSRDWIFIKECIVGGPLPPKGKSIECAKKMNENKDYLGRPHRHKEFLYNIVSNRFSGDDCDKWDYLARDMLLCLGEKGFEQSVLNRLLDNLCVAWGTCPSPAQWHDGMMNAKQAVPRRHLMICYPIKIAQAVREMFRERFEHHLRIYSHSTTQACCYMICDILLLADPFMKISTANDENNTTDNSGVFSMPISRANVHPRSFLKLTDSIIETIYCSDDPKLRPARSLINRLKSHNLYKLSCQQDVEDEEWEHNLWAMSQSNIVSELLRNSVNSGSSPPTLKNHHIIVDKRNIHHGMKDTDPVSCVRFITSQNDLLKDPDDLPTAVEICQNKCLKPERFLMKTVRIFCRLDDDDVVKHIATCFAMLIESLKSECTTPDAEINCAAFAANDDDDVDWSQDGGPITQNEFNVLTQSPVLNASLASAKRLNNGETFYGKVVKRKLFE